MNIPFGGFFGNLIKRWLTDNPPFYPLFQNFFLNRKLPILVDTNNLMLVYQSTPHLRLIIERKADFFSNGRIYVKDSKGNEVENHQALSLFKKPNVLQTQRDFMAQWSVFWDIYSNGFVNKTKVISFAGGPKALWNLPPSTLKIVPTGKLFGMTKLEDIIEKYVMFSGQPNSQDFYPKDIIHFTQGTSDAYYIGQSKILTNRIVVSNLDGAYKTRNCIIHDRGALGILSSAGKDTDGGIPLDEPERKRIESQYKKEYGIGDDQMKTIITNANLHYESMTFPTKDLMLFEEVEDDFQVLCGAFGMARDVFPSTDKATYENQSAAEKATYQNTIIPQAEMFCDVMQVDPDIAQLFKPGEKLCIDYCHLPCMKEDELKEAQAEFAEIQKLSLLKKDGIISPEAYAEMAGVKFTGTGLTEHPPTNATTQQNQPGNSGAPNQAP